MAMLTWITKALLHFPTLQRSSSISLTNLIALLQLEFATIAGAGLVVGWLVSYRKQGVAEAKEQLERAYPCPRSCDPARRPPVRRAPG
jgi:hypothetical protein